MSKFMRIVAAVLLASYAVLGSPILPKANVQSRAVVVEPSQQMKIQVREVARAVRDMNAIDRLWFQYIYSNAARVVVADAIADPPVMTTTEGLRAVHVAILKFIWKGMAENPPGKYEALSAAVEKVFNDTIGDKQRALTPDLRDKAREMFDAIAWAGLGKDE